MLAVGCAGWRAWFWLKQQKRDLAVTCTLDAFGSVVPTGKQHPSRRVKALILPRTHVIEQTLSEYIQVHREIRTSTNKSWSYIYDSFPFH